MSATMQFTKDEMREVLRRQNVSEAAIERTLDLQFPQQAVAVKDAPALDVALPFTITIPWSQLVSDNDKYSAVIVRKGEKVFPQLKLSVRYAEAKKLIRSSARGLVGHAVARAEPLYFLARVWVPDNRPGHDVANFAKLVCDAFEGIVYANDSWLHRVTWSRVGVNVDAPCAEIDIRTL